MNKTIEIAGEIAAVIHRKGYEIDEIITALEVVKATILKGYLEGLSK